METIVAIFILAVSIDLIFDFFIASGKNTRQHQDAFAVSLVLDSTISQLDPKNYTLEQLQKTLKEEAENNTFSKRGIIWVLQKNNKEVEISFLRNSETIYKTELKLP